MDEPTPGTSALGQGRKGRTAGFPPDSAGAVFFLCDTISSLPMRTLPTLCCLAALLRHSRLPHQPTTEPVSALSTSRLRVPSGCPATQAGTSLPKASSKSFQPKRWRSRISRGTRLIIVTTDLIGLPRHDHRRGGCKNRKAVQCPRANSCSTHRIPIPARSIRGNLRHDG